MRPFSFISCCLLLFHFSCQGQVQNPAYEAMLNALLSHTVPVINVEAAKTAATNTVWLDAREPREYAVSHIKGALPVGYDQADLSILEFLPKDTPIIVYCSVGYRSEKIAERCKDAGFTKVSNLYGGIFEWVNEGYPVYSDNGKTNKVHAYDKKWSVWLTKGEKVY
jgi:rhodanese-related sulfurtransferase